MEQQQQKRETLTLNKGKNTNESLEEEPYYEGEEGVQFAKPEDIPQIVALAFSAYRDTELEQISVAPNLKDVTLEVESMILDGVVLVKRNRLDPRLIDSVTCFEEGGLWWNKERPVLVQKLMYTVPEQRSVKTFMEMMRAVHKYCDMVRMAPMYSVVGNRKEKIEKILQRFGYTEISKSMMKT